jgi:hypothetical protein
VSPCLQPSDKKLLLALGLYDSQTRVPHQFTSIEALQGIEWMRGGGGGGGGGGLRATFHGVGALWSAMSLR